MPPDYCPNCGAEVPSNARACPECGADEKTGWSEDAHAQRLELPDDSFSYDEFVKEEFGERKNSRLRPAGVSWSWWIVAIVVVLALLALWSR